MSPSKSVSGRLRPFFDMIKPSFSILILMAVSLMISVMVALTLPSNMESGSPGLTFLARLYWTGTVKPPVCSKSGLDSKISSSSLCKSRRLSLMVPRRILGPWRSCRMATLRPFFSAAARIHLICWSRSSSEP